MGDIQAPHQSSKLKQDSLLYIYIFDNKEIYEKLNLMENT